MLYHGSCHCGGIAFEVEGDIGEVTRCNCSICSRRGSLLWFVPRDKLRLTTPESAMSTYTFRTHRIQHHFCPTCGCAPFADGAMPDGSPIAAVNVRCLPDVDVSGLKVREYDGKSV
ncbi:GFA family protein [Pseudomonas sp. QE6]|uniref:GFA family protein n=1 Tax=Pseudomonas sp. QE6 TaxID=3242491 RepID=UPI003526DB8F